jgi:hypothetical protein
LTKLAEGLHLEWWAIPDKQTKNAKVIYAEYLDVVRKRNALAEQEKADG